MLKVVHIEISISAFSGVSLNNVKFYATKEFSSAAQIRDAFIKKYREEYVKEYERGFDSSPSEAIYKFPFRDLVGYYHFDDGLSFVLPEEHPIYKLVASKKYKNKDLATMLLDLYDRYSDLHEERKLRKLRKVA